MLHAGSMEGKPKGSEKMNEDNVSGVEPHQEVSGIAGRDGLGNEVFHVQCCFCLTKLQAPWVGKGIVKCGNCSELLQIKRESKVSLGAHEQHSQCICDKIFWWCPAAASFYFAISLTSYIIGTGFIYVAPMLFPSPYTTAGAFFWMLSVYITCNTVANFYWGASIHPGRPPASEACTSMGAARNERSEGRSAATPEWCDKCSAAKPPGTHHCRRCKRCIYGMVS